MTNIIYIKNIRHTECMLKFIKEQKREEKSLLKNIIFFVATLVINVMLREN